MVYTRAPPSFQARYFSFRPPPIASPLPFGTSSTPSLARLVKYVSLSREPSAPCSSALLPLELIFGPRLVPGLAMSPALGESLSRRSRIRNTLSPSLDAVWSRTELENQEQIRQLLDSRARLRLLRS